MSFVRNVVRKTQDAARALEQESEAAFHQMIKVPASVRDQRMDICRGCEHLNPNLNRCNLCGCFMELKTWLPGQKCPVDKWGKHIIATDTHPES